jgi:flagellar motor switch protein FliN/FliY
MARQTDSAEQISQWIAQEWGRCFAAVIESMADQRPAASCDGIAVPFMLSGDALCSEQELSLGADCMIRMSVPELIWVEAGTRVLKAAGIDDVGRDDARSTFHEVLSQTLSGVAQAIGSRLGTEVNCVARREVESLPDETVGLSLSIDLPDVDLADSPVFVAPSEALVQQLRDATPQAAAAAASASVPLPSQGPPSSGSPSSISKTFDLLLGVHLPVSVSFGKTSMMVKDVLKLTTGSIVELNRSVTEPVDIIVNNCIIARGEVVVVAGNYGVRVREIVSKEQRYMTGIRPPLLPTRE